MCFFLDLKEKNHERICYCTPPICVYVLFCPSCALADLGTIACVGFTFTACKWWLTCIGHTLLVGLAITIFVFTESHVYVPLGAIFMIIILKAADANISKARGVPQDCDCICFCKYICCLYCIICQYQEDSNFDASINILFCST